MKKDRSNTTGYNITEIAIAVAIFILLMIVAGTIDYNDAKESETYWKTQRK